MISNHLKIKKIIRLIQLFEISEMEALKFWKGNYESIKDLVLQNLDFVIDRYLNPVNESFSTCVEVLLLGLDQEVFTLKNCLSLSLSNNDNFGEYFENIALKKIKSISKKEVSYLITLLQDKNNQELANVLLMKILIPL